MQLAWAQSKVVRHSYDGNNITFFWIKLGTIVLPQDGTTAVIRFFGGSGYNGLKEQMAAAEIHIRTSNGNVNSEGFAFSAYTFRTGWAN